MPICTYSNNNWCKLWSLWLENITAISFENCFGDSMLYHGWQSICLQAGQIHSPSHWHWFGMFFWSCPVKRKMSSTIIYIIPTYKEYCHMISIGITIIPELTLNKASILSGSHKFLHSYRPPSWCWKFRMVNFEVVESLRLKVSIFRPPLWVLKLTSIPFIAHFNWLGGP